MCAASRALWSVALLSAGYLLTGVAWAEAPVISTPPAPPPAEASAPPAPAVPSVQPSSPAPPFTPAPEPSFTAGSPALPSASTAPAPAAAPGTPPAAAAPPAPAPPAYVAPAYSSPPTFDGRARAPAPASSATLAPQLADAAKPTPTDDPRWNDAHVDRVVLLPTGETHPAGTTYLSSYEIVGLQAGHALSDRMQLTLSFVPPLTRDPIVPLDLTLKGVLVRSRRVRVAAMTSTSGLLGFESGSVLLGRVGGVTQLCFDDRCASSISMAANVVFAGQLIVVDGVGIIARVNHAVSLLFELQSVLPIGRDVSEIHALAGAAGIRIAGKRLALDIAFEGPIDRRTKPQAIPLIVGTYRFLP